MVSFDARRQLATVTRCAVTLVMLLAPFSAPAQTADTPPSDACAQSALPDSGSPPQTMGRSVRRTLDKAARAFNANKYAEARATVDQLEVDKLTPYELAMAEAVLFRTASAERKYDEARHHVVRAIESCGLTDEGIAIAQDAIKRIDGRLAMEAACGGGPLCASTLEPLYGLERLPKVRPRSGNGPDMYDEFAVPRGNLAER